MEIQGIKRLVGDRLLVKPDKISEITHGGILIPGTVDQKAKKGVVVDLNTEKVGQVFEGDTVFFGKFAGTEVSIAGEKHIIMRQSDVVARQAKK